MQPAFTIGKTAGPLLAVGNPEILNQPLLALFCSGKAPASILLAVQDLAKRWREQGQVIISGFQSPAEQEALAVLLKGKQPIVICLARGIGPQVIKPAWRDAHAANRLLVVSPFAAIVTRPTAETAETRNRVVAAMANEVLIAYARRGSKTEALAKEVISWGKLAFVIKSQHNESLQQLGLSWCGQ